MWKWSSLKQWPSPSAFINSVAVNNSARTLARSVAAGQEALRSTQPDLVVAALEQNRNALDLDQAGHRLYLIDPQGLVVMRYPALDEPALLKAALKDQERLLRFS